MSDPSAYPTQLPPEQQAIRAKCFHPSGTFVEFPKEDIEKSIVERFEKIAGMYPNRIAVKTSDRQLTYAQLNRAANSLAIDILARSGTEQEAVALLFPKGTSLVVAVLAVLKCGKFFVLLDPTLPKVRLQYMLGDSQARLVVTGQENVGASEAMAPPESLLLVDELRVDTHAENPRLPLTPDHLAYLLYTSGSTGSPKGIIESHRNLLHYIMVETNDLHICTEDRLTFFASQGRDIFRAVLNGATVYPLELKDEGFRNLARLLIEEKITIYNSVASAFRDFVNSLTGAEYFPQLRLIKLMGETVYRRDVELYKKYFSERRILVNWYGPNEAGLLTHYLIDRDSQVTTNAVPVGHAVKDKEILILDENGNDVGVQQTGEIAVRSRYLSPGYWRRPELTATAFTGASSEGTGPLYRTGDLGSIGPYGCLMHLGRKDSQVKIRGNRVEIAEVEMALLDLDVVREAAVVAREDILGHKRLVAYVVPAAKSAPTVSSLRNALATKLPDYMVPSVFVFLYKMPVIAIGKIDRNALPLPDQRRPRLDVPYVPPRNSVEEKLVRIWSEVLSLDQVGVDDHFFDLGGHSLTATRVISQIVRAFQLELPLKALFDSPTVAETAKVIGLHQSKAASQAEVSRILTELEAMSEEGALKSLAEEGRAAVTRADHD